MSYGSENIISFLSTPIKKGKEATFIPPSLQWDYRMLRTIGVLGYNSSGKTNLLNAIAAMKYAVLYSGTTTENLFLKTVTPFLLKKDNKEPSHFEVIFFLNNRKYRYGYKILNGAVIEESLDYADPKIRENNLFFRLHKNVTFSKVWNKESENSLDPLFKRVQDHNLFLSVLGFLNVQPAVDILNWFGKIIVVETFNPDRFIDFTVEKLQDAVFKHIFTRLLRESKIGFDTILEEKISNSEKLGSISGDFVGFMLENEILPKNRYNINTIHPVFDKEGNSNGSIKFDLRRQESAGTKKFFGLIGLFLEAISESKILIFDEIETQFHFALYESLIRFFNDPIINPKGAQLLYTSHNTTLLKGNKLRRDQFYHIEKNSREESVLIRFHEKGNTLRSDASLEKEYQEKTIKNKTEDFNLFSGLTDI
jgi:AAA15 family ATPase/GTPase